MAKTAVWCWQERFMAEGVDGLLHYKTRPSCIPPLGPQVAEQVVCLTLAVNGVYVIAVGGGLRSATGADRPR